MAIIDAAQLYRALSGLGQCHAGSTPFSKDTLISDLVILRLAAETLRRDFLEPFPSGHRHRIRCACHRVCGLAAARHAGERQVLRGVAPDDIALVPGDAENLRSHAMDVNDRLRPQIANAGLEGDPAVGLHDEKPVEADRAAVVNAQGYADATHF